ncbi:hypothetical protein FQN57_007408 [Myotisia sp. PD_48]|nr:hypothetical protein FQN57_007408 [Myotisia sp. PD_48]
MFRLLPWSSVVGRKKVTEKEDRANSMAVAEHSPTVDLHSHGALKRKRLNSCESRMAHDSHNAPVQPHIRPTTLNVVPNSNSLLPQTTDSSSLLFPDNIPPTPPNSNKSCAHSDATQSSTLHSPPQPTPPFHLRVTANLDMRNMDPDTLRRAIESQISLEILLKHEELRSIEQEMAKCQIALEQLRRCSEIPFPGSSVTGSTETVSNGTGAAISTSRDQTGLPTSPPPWGVSDGPYTRHYARWLLPDPRFDGVEHEADTAAKAGKAPADGRTTRASWAETTNPSSRSQRAGSSAKLHALANGYPPSKDKAGPMIIKRKSDGQFVKLICLDCRRDNFSSTQGFINHCRIAHNRSFASHDAAAAASGEPVEVDEAGAIIGKSHESPNAGPAGYVHPLIRSAHLVESANESQQQTQLTNHQQTSTPLRKSTLSDRHQMIDTDDCSPVFKASPQTPHLSALMNQKGIKLNLSGIVNDALTKTDIEAMSSSGENSDSEMMENSTPPPEHARSQFSIRGSRLPTRTVALPSHPQRSGSRKGTENGRRKPRSPTSPRSLRPPSIAYQTPYHGPSVRKETDNNNPHPNADVDMIDSTLANLSPNTLESNQAPSLVSDDEDYEAASRSNSPSSNSSEVGDDENSFDNFEVRDGDNQGEESSISDRASTHISCHQKQHAPPMTRPPPPSSTRNKNILSKAAHERKSANPTSMPDNKRMAVVKPHTSTPKKKKDLDKRQRRR